MSESNKEPKRRPLKSVPPDRFQPKVLIIWAAILAALFAVVYFNPGKASTQEELKIQQVVERAERGEILKGAIRGIDLVVITGELKPAASLASAPAAPAATDVAAAAAATAASPTAAAVAPAASASATVTDAKTAAVRRTFRAEGRLTDKNLERLQATKLFEELPANTVWMTILGNVLPFVLIIGLLYFLFVRQLRSASRGALTFGKSRAKLLNRDREKTTFAQVAGCDEAKEEISEVVEFLKDPKKFQKMGGKIPKGILLVGPPGTGKTLLAKAVAGEAEVPFFSVSGSDFVEMFVGVGASRVRDMFEQGRKNAPCIIFIDEIDAVGRQRGAGLGGGNDEREQTLNSMLVEMDGFDTSEGVIIIAATNRPDVLDQALLRPGRFDRQVFVDLPDLQGREQILKVHARKINLSEDVQLSEIARGTSGFSGADLANLLNEGALLAARRNKKKVERIDLDDAREKVLFGREHRRAMDDEEKKMTAYHEAGHALVQALLDDGIMPVHKVTIIPRGRSLGSTMFIPKKDILTQHKKRLLNQIAMGLGGRIAEELVMNDISNGASGDIKHITKIARSMVCDWGMSDLGPLALGDNQDTVFLGRDITRTSHVSEATAQKIDAEIRRIIDEQLERARKLIAEHRVSLDKIAEALLEYETIEGKHVQEILDHGELRSPVIRTVPPAVPPPGDDGKSGHKKQAEEPDTGALSGAPAPMPT
ncbi:ATP-dependent zinc metalloprotease FtsH [Geminisphaera colitermitum]|uniref:ATP-dependent zinc metalloprotease FtsH n=1 Tax=Geminisphaera colitermitum TaxID=1148786 RepID=UPI000196506D|nr:ATP-dependent zinc metalloprotease FtsH [Geminisphaera colitermitum]